MVYVIEYYMYMWLDKWWFDDGWEFIINLSCIFFNLIINEIGLFLNFNIMWRKFMLNFEINLNVYIFCICLIKLIL